MSYRQRITIQTPVTTFDPYGDPTITSYTNTYVNIPARWIHTGGAESFRGRQIQSDIVGVFEIRYHPQMEIDPSMSLLWEGTRYEVYSVRPKESKSDHGRYCELEIFVKAIG